MDPELFEEWMMIGLVSALVGFMADFQRRNG